MSVWPARLLGDIADESGGDIRTGPFGSQLHRHDYTDSSDGVPVVMPVNMVGGRVNGDAIAKVSPRKAVEMSAHATRTGDVLLSRRGDIGRYCLIDAASAGALCGTGSMRVSIQGSELMPEYFCLFLETSAGLHELQGKAVGSTMPNINSSIVRSLELPVPPRSTQSKIVGISSAYDDLITNNNRRIKLLEEMAQRIYREWFVNFRFPGHEGVRMVESELGPIPEGWEIRPIGDCFKIVGGATPSTTRPEFWEVGTINWYTPSDLTDHKEMFISRSQRKITGVGLDNCSARLFPAGSVMMTSRATLGVRAVNTEEACTNQGFITCLPNDRASAYRIYFWMGENLERIIGLASGATFKEISKRVFRTIPFLMPPEGIEQRFVATVRPSLDLVRNRIQANQTLKFMRDLLLPKLISGQLDVSDLDIDLGQQVA